MGDVYNDANALSQHITEIVAEQRGDVPKTYPADYPYYPLDGKDGKSLITKVGDQNYSAWLKRGDDGVFTDIVLLNRHQVDNIYSSRPSTHLGNNVFAENFVAGEVNEATSYLIAADGGNYSPDIVIVNGTIVEDVQNISFETGLQGRQNAISQGADIDVNAMVEADYAAAMEAIAAHQASLPPREEFNNKAAQVTPVKASKLDAHLDKLDDKMESGAADSQLNRVISNGVLKYLHGTRRNETLFASETTKAIAGLRERGLDGHADILAEYANGSTDMKVARKALRKVETNPAAKFIPPAPAEPMSEPVSIDDAMDDFKGRMENIAPMLDEARAAVSAMQAGITLDALEKAMESQGLDPNSLTDNEKQELRNEVKSSIGDAAKSANDDINDAISPDKVRAMMQNAFDGIPDMLKSRLPEMEQSGIDAGLAHIRDKFDKAAQGGASQEQLTAACEILLENPAYKALDCSNIGAPAR